VLGDHPVFDLTRWDVRSFSQYSGAGGTLLFAPEVWEQRPFRPLVKAEDGRFFLDQHRLGTRILRVTSDEMFMLVRHGNVSADRGQPNAHAGDMVGNATLGVRPSWPHRI
jgi:hypothetical protein